MSNNSKLEKDQKPGRLETLRRERRVRRVAVDINIFGDLIRDGIQHTVLSTGLPGDALFVDAGYVPSMYGCNFFYAHESFDPVAVGVEVPLLEVTMTRVDAAA